MKRLKAVVRKEFRHILRDPKSLLIVFVLPVLMIFIFGYSLSFDLTGIETMIVDHSRSRISDDLVSIFAASPSYLIRYPGSGRGVGDAIREAEEQLRKGRIKQYIIFPVDLTAAARNSPPGVISAVIDGSDSNVANIIHRYNEQLLMTYLAGRTDLGEVLKISTKMYFNPENKSSHYIIPGLVAVIMIMISALLTSLSVAREKETGSIDLLFISPLRSGEIILGKTLPYVLVALLEGGLIMLFARFWFGIPLRGHPAILGLFALLYILAGLSLGILISTAAGSQKVAMLVTLLATLLPSILLSGFIFPLDSLSPLLRAFSALVPATYFLRIIRGVVLKGAELRHFIGEGAVLLGFGAVLLGVASAKFSRSRRVGR